MNQLPSLPAIVKGQPANLNLRRFLQGKQGLIRSNIQGMSTEMPSRSVIYGDEKG